MVWQGLAFTATTLVITEHINPYTGRIINRHRVPDMADVSVCSVGRAAHAELCVARRCFTYLMLHSLILDGAHSQLNFGRHA
jgi:hypothetical protein